jgi:hypothetical protein
MQVQRLQNRIAHLQKEEDLANKKVEDARKRAIVILTNKSEKE